VNYKHNEAFCKAFGDHLRKLREERGLSMRGLAANADLDYNQIYRVENGIVNTTISMVLAIAEGLNVSPQELFSFQFPPKGKK
jgi:transcriptional regulator with XRE-family HTH domain